MNLKRSLFVGGLLATALATQAHATPVAKNLWYNFNFPATPGVLVDPADGTNNPGPHPWTITSATAIRFFLTDMFNPGDTFTLFDGALIVGATPFVVADGDHFCATEDTCYADAVMSHAFFDLAPGTYSFTIRVDNAPFPEGGYGGFRIEDAPGSTVPEPSTFVLMASGLVAVAGLRRRKSR